MLTEEGIIDETRPGKAVIRIQRSSACAGCASSGMCQILTEKEMKIEATNTLHAKVGDHVEISVPTGTFLKVTFFVYFVPIVALIMGAYVGAVLAKALNIQSTLASILGAAIAMGISFYVLKIHDKGATAKQEYYPRVTRILQSDPGKE